MKFCKGGGEDPGGGGVSYSHHSDGFIYEQNWTIGMLQTVKGTHRQVAMIPMSTLAYCIVPCMALERLIKKKNLHEKMLKTYSDFLWRHKCDKCHFALWYYYSLSFTWSSYFQWLWSYFKVTAVWNLLMWQFYVLVWFSKLKHHLIVSQRHWQDHKYTT